MPKKTFSQRESSSDHGSFSPSSFSFLLHSLITRRPKPIVRLPLLGLSSRPCIGRRLVCRRPSFISLRSSSVPPTFPPLSLPVDQPRNASYSTSTPPSFCRSPEKADFSNAASSYPYRKQRHPERPGTPQPPPGRRRLGPRRHLSRLRERMHMSQKAIRSLRLLRANAYCVLFDFFTSVRCPSLVYCWKAPPQNQVDVTPKSQVSQAARDSFFFPLRRPSRDRRPRCRSILQERPARPQTAGPAHESSRHKAQRKEEGRRRRHGVQGQGHDRNFCRRPQIIPTSSPGREYVFC